jgi:hypothetical protein
LGLNPLGTAILGIVDVDNCVASSQSEPIQQMKLIHHPSTRIAALIAQTGTQIHNSQVCRLFLEMPLKKNRTPCMRPFQQKWYECGMNMDQN